MRSSTSPLLLALVLQLVNDLMGTFQTAVRLSLDIDNYMNSINRCLAYTDIPVEDLLKDDLKDDDFEYDNARRRAMSLPMLTFVK